MTYYAVGSTEMISRRREARAKAKKEKARVVIDDTMIRTSILSLRCLRCNATWQETLGSYLVSRGCRACTKLRLAKLSSLRNKGSVPGNAIDRSTFESKLPKGYTLLRFARHPKRSLVVCDKGHSRETTNQNILRFRCRICTGHSMNAERHTAFLQKYNKNIECLLYTSSFEDSKYRCNGCGHMWFKLTTNMARKGEKRCPGCSPPLKGVKSYRLGKRLVRLRGYEPFALDYLLGLGRYKPEDIQTELEGTVPRLRVGRKEHRPDFYIPKENRLVEVKSLGTLGWSKDWKQGKGGWTRLKKNKAAAVANGFVYSLLVMNGKGQRIVLKPNWEELTLKQSVL